MIHSKITSIPDDGTSDIQATQWNDVHVLKVQPITIDTILDITYDTILVTCGDGVINITLPSPTIRSGQEYKIMRPVTDIGSGLNTGICNILGTINDNSNGYSLANPGQHVTIFSDGILWYAYGN
jgi:hypothetical protein